MKIQFSDKQIEEAGHNSDNIGMVRALCEHLGCEPCDLNEIGHEHYGLKSFSFGGQEYAIGTNAQADKAARLNIEDSIWAFNASFILSECNLPGELEEGLKAWQEKECEGCNDELLRMVNRLCGDSFFEAAISADGRGHFLSGYDGEENDVVSEGETFYIYRTN